jgi:hypothetical protein
VFYIFKAIDKSVTWRHSSAVEHWTANPVVAGSIPAASCVFAHSQSFQTHIQHTPQPPSYPTHIGYMVIDEDDTNHHFAYLWGRPMDFNTPLRAVSPDSPPESSTSSLKLGSSPESRRSVKDRIALFNSNCEMAGTSVFKESRKTYSELQSVVVSPRMGSGSLGNEERPKVKECNSTGYAVQKSNDEVKERERISTPKVPFQVHVSATTYNCLWQDMLYNSQRISTKKKCSNDSLLSFQFN